MTFFCISSLLVALLAMLYCQPALLAAGHPYDPHEHQESPFFEGWYLRITTSNNGPTFAVGIGHLPQQSVRNPSAACFLLLNPPAGAAAAVAAAAANTTTPTSTAKAAPVGLQQPRAFTHYFSSLDVHPGKQQAGCIGCPAFVASGDNAGGSCRLEVTGSLVTFQAEVPGAFKLSASNDPNNASIVPWGDNPASSPEGWLPGSMLKLHWYVYSMATPISYQLTLLNTTTPQGTAATVITPVSRTKQQQHQPAGTGSGDPAPAAGTARSSSSSDTDNKALAAEGAALSFSGAGFAHMEKNWGDAFPDQWVWAQGNTGDGKSSFVLAGGPLPIRLRPTPTAASSLPHSSSWRGEPLAFGFSLHSPNLNLTIDASHPGWVSSFEPCSCCSSLAIKLDSWGHEVVLHVEAQRGSFAALPCPTADGFLYKTSESFAATAHVRVYGSSASTALSDASMLTTPLGWRGKQKLLLASAVFEGAALEFGGLFRCAGAGGRAGTGPRWHKLFAQQ